ncbi:DNA mismatch repair protein MutT [Agromyces badenianii]|uniref:8-oxo-dGTP diphosphatase n=1 Tax=Agromyces badenianii TaxID=2080742 RepID=A0A2S0WYE3_9MICO|nr:(deoxy)nucleoside triphosphate pyrophosphohydrolase [Agromyces badenianii]AWB96375.1 DNA mismatch repair protein MutT [Agromyces badenianii]
MIPVVLEVVAAAIILDDRIFACRRAPGRASAGCWELPGGKVEPGESPRDALRREIAEELSVTIVTGALIDRSQTTVGDQVIDLATYESRIIGSLPTRSTDHDELGWFTRSELRGLQWAAPDLPAVVVLASNGNPG